MMQFLVSYLMLSLHADHFELLKKIDDKFVLYVKLNMVFLIAESVSYIAISACVKKGKEVMVIMLVFFTFIPLIFIIWGFSLIGILTEQHESNRYNPAEMTILKIFGLRIIHGVTFYCAN